MASTNDYTETIELDQLLPKPLPSNGVLGQRANDHSETEVNNKNNEEVLQDPDERDEEDDEAMSLLFLDGDLGEVLQDPETSIPQDEHDEEDDEAMSWLFRDGDLGEVLQDPETSIPQDEHDEEDDEAMSWLFRDGDLGEVLQDRPAAILRSRDVGNKDQQETPDNLLRDSTSQHAGTKKENDHVKDRKSSRSSVHPPKIIRRADMCGQWYEVKMAALLYIRSINSGCEFEIATNVQGAGALDDIVFKFKSPENPEVWQTCFIQLKHKTGKKASIREDNLIAGSGDFSIKKYFESYVDIEEIMTGNDEDKPDMFEGSKFDLCHFVIFTNAPLHNKVTSSNNVVNESPIDMFLKMGESTEFIYNFTEKDNKIFSSFNQDKADKAKDFLKKLRLYTREPKEDKLDDIIKSELKTYCERNNISYIDTMYDKYELAFKKWWDDNDACLLDHENCIHREILDKAQSDYLSVILEDHAKKQKQELVFDITFSKESTEQLVTSLIKRESFIRVVTDDSTIKIVATKVIQVLENEDHSYVFSGTKALSGEQRGRFLTYWKCSSNDIAVIVNDQTSDVGFLREELVQVLRERVNKKVVLVSTIDDPLARELMESLELNEENQIQERFEASQINPDSISNILDKVVCFQGQSSLLRSLFKGDFSALSKSFKDTFFENIEKKDSYTLADSLKSVDEFFIPRILHLKNVVNPGIFSVKNFKGKIVIENAELKNVRQFMLGKEKRFEERGTGLEFRVTRSSTAKTPGEIEDTELMSSKTNLNVGIKKVEDVHDRETLQMFESSSNDIHTLQLADGRLLWKQSSGNIEFIKRYLDDKPDHLADTQRVSLLVAEPGMGKSTQLTHIAQRIKEDNPNMWVVSIALSKHTALLSRISSEINIKSFLSSALRVEEDSIENELLTHCLSTSGNMAVLLDGVDEIAPGYVEQCCELLKSLLKSKVRYIWVASRPSMKDVLESTLSTLAISLKSFSEVDQKSFLSKYWTSLNLPQDELERYVSELLNTTSESLNDKEKQFTGNPLQARMLAEVYHDDINNQDGQVSNLSKGKSKVPKKWNLLELIEKFVEKRRSFYIKRVCDIDDQKPGNKIHGIYNYVHSKAALVALDLRDGDLNKLLDAEGKEKAQVIVMIDNTLVDLLDHIERDKANTGIISSFCKETPIFVHRIFIQYFAAKWFAENYDKAIDFIKAHLFSDTFRIFGNLFDRILAKDLELHTAVLNSDVAGVKTLLEENVDLKETDKAGRTALHLAMTAYSENPSEQNQRIEILNMLLKSDSDKCFKIKDNLNENTPLDYADASGFWKAIGLVRKRNPEKKITQNELKNTAKPMAFTEDFAKLVLKDDREDIMKLIFDLEVSHRSRFVDNRRSTLLHKSSELGSESIVNLLIRIEPNVRVTDRTNATPLHRAAENNRHSVAKKLVETDLKTSCRHILGESPREKYVNVLDNQGNTALSLAAEKGHHDVVDYLIQSESYIADKNYSHWTPLMKASANGHQSVAKLLLDRIVSKDNVKSKDTKKQSKELGVVSFAAGKVNKLILDLDERSDKENIKRKYIREQNKENNTALSLAAAGGHDQLISFLLSHGADVATKDSYTGWNPLMSASYYGRQNVVKLLLESDVRNPEYVNRRDLRKRTALFLAAKMGHHEIVKILIANGGDVGAEDDEQETPLISACSYGHKQVVYILLGSFEDMDAKVKYVNKMSSKGHTAILLAAWNGCLDIVDSLIKSGSEIALKDELNGLGWTPLFSSSVKGHKTVVERLLLCFGDSKEKADYINIQANDGNSALFFASKKGHTEIIQMLIDLGGHVDGKSKKGKSCLMTACFNGHKEVVQLLLDNITDTDIRRAYINAVSSERNTAICYASSQGHTDIVEVLITEGADVTIVDKTGATTLMYATRACNEQLVRKILESVKDTVKKKEYVNKRDREGDSALHMAASEGCEALLKVLAEAGGDREALNYSERSPIMIFNEVKNKDVTKASSPTVISQCFKDISCCCDSDD